MALWILSGTSQVSRYQKKQSPIHTYRGHQSSLICFLHVIQSMASSQFNLHAWQSFPQSLSKFSFVYLLAWHPQLHTPYISSPNHCLLFKPHAHTIATCFAVVPRLCHLILVSQPFTWNSILWLNATRPSNHSQLCPLQCHLIFLSYRPGLMASIPPLSFLQAGCPSCRPTNSIKALKATSTGHTFWCQCKSG